MAKPNKIQIRLEKILKKRTKKLSPDEINIIADVGILENAVGSLMDIIVRNHTLACATVLIDEYKFTKSEAERFIKLSSVQFDKLMNE